MPHVVTERIVGVDHDPAYAVHHFACRCHPRDELATPRPDLAEIPNAAYWSSDSLSRPVSDAAAYLMQDALPDR